MLNPFASLRGRLVKTLYSINRARLLALFAVASQLHSPAQTTFTKITTGPVVSDGGDGQSCAWVDFDNDGDLDLYASCNHTGANLLYRNDGNGVFTRITTGPIVNAGVGSVGTAWADFDNDGLMDLFVSRQDDGPGLLFRQGTDGVFTKTTLATGFSFGAAWADYDLDGFIDLMVGDRTKNLLWHNDGLGHLLAVASTPIVTVGFRPNITWADYNNDGRPDLFVSTGGTAGSGNGRLYRNDGQGVFTRITSGPLVTLTSNSTGLAWADYDNDGFLDVFVCRLDNSFNRALPSLLFRNNGDGTFTEIHQGPFINDLGYGVSCSWGDYDNDGWLDLIVSNYANGGNNRLYHNNGDGTFTRILSGTVANDLGNSSGAVWGDYNRDGALDLFIANGTLGNAEPNDFLYHNDGNTNAWLAVKCIGTVGNRSALGAKIRVKATIAGKTFWQTRELNTGDGWSQSALEAHLGLGNATNAETLRIEWPSGTVQEFQNVASKQLLTITEPSRLSATNSNGALQLSLQGGRGFRYDIQSSSDLKVWSNESTLTITNFNGAIQVAHTNAPVAEQKMFRAILR